MNIYGKNVFLRNIEMSDSKLIRELFNNPEIEKNVVGWAYPISSYSQEKWIESHYNDKDSLRLVIETNDNDAVGIATITNIDWKNRNATHGIKILNKENRKKGIGTDAVMAIMRYSFDELGLHRLNGSVFGDNTASRKLYTKLGWKEEGIRREFIYKSGEWKDLIITGILAQDYYKLVEDTKYWDK